MCCGHQTSNRYGYCLLMLCLAGPWLASLVTANLSVPILSTSLHAENWTHMGPARPLRRDIVLFLVPSDSFAPPQLSWICLLRDSHRGVFRSMLNSLFYTPLCQWPPDCGAGPPMYPANPCSPQNKWNLPQSHILKPCGSALCPLLSQASGDKFLRLILFSVR